MKFQNQLEIMLYHGYISMKNKPNMLNTHSSIGFLKRPKHALFKDNKERGWPSPSWDFKALSLPLKSLKISVVRRPQTPKSQSSLKIAQNGAPQGLRGVKHLQTTKHSKQTI